MLMQYETNRLMLCIVRADAAPQVLDFFQRDRALFEQYEPDRAPHFYTLGFQRETLKYEYSLATKLSHIRFYVYRKEDPDTIIGTVCFHNITQNPYYCCEIGYKFSSAFHHQGYALEAVEKGIDIMFSELQIHRIMAWVMPENEPSIRLLQSLGFAYEGMNSDHLYMHGKWVSHAQYSLISPMKLF